MDKRFSEMTFAEQLSAYESAKAEVSRLKESVEAFKTQVIEYQADVVAFRHDIEVVEHERDQARKELEDWKFLHSPPIHNSPEGADKEWINVLRVN
jgi:predicted  nucleic acid-binding Zn-ribbon protein